MTDYNDGKWHGWNGGECPVHEKSVVVIQRRGDTRVDADMEREDDVWEAGNWNWSDDDETGDIIAFRVIKPYRDPREFYAVQLHWHGFGSDEKLWTECNSKTQHATLFREVLPD